MVRACSSRAVLELKNLRAFCDDAIGLEVVIANAEMRTAIPKKNFIFNQCWYFVCDSGEETIVEGCATNGYPQPFIATLSIK